MEKGFFVGKIVGRSVAALFVGLAEELGVNSGSVVGRTIGSLIGKSIGAIDGGFVGVSVIILVGN